MSSTDSRQRFSNRVEDYVRYRPSYPPDLLAFLWQRTGLDPTVRVADIGSGTGIFSRLLIEAGATVFAVEPNAAMRAAAEAAFGGQPRFASLEGTAEATGLPERSVSLITCAQAFHWFDPASARREFVRILSPDGWCALIWNTPVRDGSAFALGYEKIKTEFGTDFERIRHESIPLERFTAFFGRPDWDKRRFANSQTLDYSGLKGRLLSSSYAPKPGQPGHVPMLAALEELYARCQQGGFVRMDYATELFLGQFAGTQ
jgi:SAM-dependent methyltransferase